MAEGNSNDIDSSTELFRYYVDQTRHCENLWLQSGRFFSAIITALVGGTFVLIEIVPSEVAVQVVRIMSFVGILVSILAVGIIRDYQLLIKEWVKKKNAMEDELFRRSESLHDVAEIVHEQRREKIFILPFSIAVFSVFALLFAVLFTLSLVWPEGISEAVWGTTTAKPGG